MRDCVERVGTSFVRAGRATESRPPPPAAAALRGAAPRPADFGEPDRGAERPVAPADRPRPPATAPRPPAAVPRPPVDAPRPPAGAPRPRPAPDSGWRLAPAGLRDPDGLMALLW